MSQLFQNDVWVEQQFAATDLKDARLTSRLVKVASRIVARPEANLPQQMEKWSELKAAYRFLNNSNVTHKRLQMPHRELVKRLASAGDIQATILFIQDGSEIDLTNLTTARGLGPIGNHTCQGIMIHSCLAIRYDKTNPEVIGLPHQQVWQRENISLCRTETRGQRNNRKNKESDVWLKTLRAIGSPAGRRWVSVGDRANDIYEFLSGAKNSQWEVLIRANQDRLIEVKNKQTYLVKYMHALPVMGTDVITIRKKGDTKPKEVTVNIAWEQVTIKPPQRVHKKGTDITLSVVRCWSEEEEIDWVLYSSIPVHNLDEAIEKLKWYACRWTIEEYHKCLKTGCKIESSQLESSRAHEALLGMLGVIAIMMLQLRNASREDGERLASEVIPESAIKIIHKRYGLDIVNMSIREFWRSVAMLGGFIGRKSDGDPGWQTLWRGWLRLLDMWWSAEALTSV